jgi:hypothetical protein
LAKTEILKDGVPMKRRKQRRKATKQRRTAVPRPDQLPGPIRKKKPTGKIEDRPLGQLKLEAERYEKARSIR